MSDTSLLPPNATPQERALSLSIERAANLGDKIVTVWDPYTCPAEFLPWLAWSLSVDGWSSDWTEAQKRSAIASSISVLRHKGTFGALRRALQALGYEVVIDENTGTAYTFRLRLDCSEKGTDNDDLFDEAERIANRVKNVRSHLTGVDALIQSSCDLFIHVRTLDGQETKVWPEILDSLPSTPLACILIAEQTIDTVAIYPTN